jgi:hypothetical protein
MINEIRVLTLTKSPRRIAAISVTTILEAALSCLLVSAVTFESGAPLVSNLLSRCVRRLYV